MRWIVLLSMITFLAHAEVGEEVIIKGKIGNDFNTERIKITDSLGQTYYLKTKYFPAGFQPKQGKEFSIEVPQEALDNVKIIK